MSEIEIMNTIKNRDSDWDKRLNQKNGDLFWSDSSKLVIVTKNGFRSPFTEQELMEIERGRND